MKKRYWIPLLILAILIAFRIALPSIVTSYINSTINDMPDYEGSIAGVDISLLQSSYSVDSLKIQQVNWEEEGGLPWLSVDKIDFSVNWGYLLQGAIVGSVELHSPVLRFVAAPEVQAGEGVNWPEMLQQIMPVHINRFIVTDGTVVYHDFTSEPELELSVDDLQVEMWNISNVESSEEELPTRFELNGVTTGDGALAIQADLSLLHEIPHIDLVFELEDLDLTALNRYLEAFAGVDAESGTFDLYSEFAVEEGLMEGYVQPMFHNLSILDLSEEDQGFFSTVWEGIVEGATQIFRNQPEDQLATQVPFSGRVDNPDVGVFPSIWNIFRNAFIDAFQAGAGGEIEFGPAGGGDEDSGSGESSSEGE